MTGQILKTTYEQAVVEAGLPGDLCKWKFEDWAAIFSQKLWISETWRFCSDNNIKIRTNGEGKLRPRRRNDRFLMPEFKRRGFKGAQLARINRCRMFLKVITVGDIATIEGDHVHPAIEKGEIARGYARKDVQWPVQPKPSPNDWREWTRAIQSLKKVHYMSRLDEPVGHWIEREE